MEKFFTIVVFCIALTSLGGCDDVTKIAKPLIEGDDFETPFDMLSRDLNISFSRGEEAFMKAFTVKEGLGPIFNNTSCVGCHPGNGRGTPDLGLIRFSMGHDLILEMGGPQFQDNVIPGVPYGVLLAGVNTSVRLPPPVFGMGLIENIPVETILSYADETDANGDGISGKPNWVTPPDYLSFTLSST